MRVLLVNTLYFPNIVGGAERSVQLLAEALVKKGHEVFVATLSSGEAGANQLVNGVNVYYLPLQNIYFPFKDRQSPSVIRALWHSLDTYNPRMASAVTQILDKVKPDVVHTHNIAGFSVAVWGVVKERQLPLVHTLRDYYLLCPRSTMFKNGKNCNDICTECRIFSAPKRVLTKYVDVVTGVSHFIVEQHIKHGYFRNSRRAVVYNPYDAPGIDPKADFVFKANAMLRFGYMGRLHPTKGVELLLRSFSALPPGRAELWIAGKGDPDYEAKLKGMVAGREGVRWLGFVTPEELLGSVDVLVVPSLWHDPAPRVVLEAMGNGVPVVGAQRGGIPELVDEAGWIFDPDKPGELEAQLQRCLSHPNEVRAMSQRARERAKLFSSENMLSGYLRIYESLLKENVP